MELWLCCCGCSLETPFDCDGPSADGPYEGRDEGTEAGFEAAEEFFVVVRGLPAAGGASKGRGLEEEADEVGDWDLVVVAEGLLAGWARLGRDVVVRSVVVGGLRVREGVGPRDEAALEVAVEPTALAAGLAGPCDAQHGTSRDRRDPTLIPFGGARVCRRSVGVGLAALMLCLFDAAGSIVLCRRTPFAVAVVDPPALAFPAVAELAAVFVVPVAGLVGLGVGSSRMRAMPETRRNMP